MQGHEIVERKRTTRIYRAPALRGIIGDPLIIHQVKPGEEYHGNAPTTHHYGRTYQYLYAVLLRFLREHGLRLPVAKTPKKAGNKRLETGAEEVANGIASTPFPVTYRLGREKHTEITAQKVYQEGKRPVLEIPVSTGTIVLSLDAAREVAKVMPEHFGDLQAFAKISKIIYKKVKVVKRIAPLEKIPGQGKLKLNFLRVIP